MSSIKVIDEKCIGCKKCVSACPFAAIQIENKKAVILDNCTLCGSCVESCRFNAIELTVDEVAHEDISTYHGVWVFAETFDGQLRNVGLELLGQAQQLAADLHTKVTAVLIGHPVKHLAQELIAYGADDVFVADDTSLKDFNDQSYTDIMASLVEKQKPEIILLGATMYGRSFAPRVAARLRTGLTADCTGLSIDLETKLLEQTRPAFGGNLMATIICPYYRPQMATVRPGVFATLPQDETRTGQIHELPVKKNPVDVETIARVLHEEQGVSIADAEVIVAAGRGINSPKNVQLVKELAELMGAAVGASRAVVDLGWLPYSQQIGQTGKTVGPKLYIAVGVSGAIQHLAGMSSAQTIVAINSDSDAPIFKVAHYALVGDCSELLPELIAQLKAVQ